MSARRVVLVVAVATLGSGCFTVRYLGQAAAGQYELLHVARPISTVLEDPAVPLRVKALLVRVGDVKGFARAQGLTPTRSYRRYADLKRPAAVWIVQACAPLKFEVKRWEFPVVGSVPYLGFFAEEDAHALADELARGGLDVAVRPAVAYSTLGWFPDPVLSTMLGDDGAALGDLANVLFHESVHATVYIPGQSAFDESLASFVADRLTLMWLHARLPRYAPQTLAYIADDVGGRARVRRLHQAYEALDAVYRSTMPDDEKRKKKTQLLAALNAELRVRTPLNNASLAGYKTYATGTEGFERLLNACGGNLGRLLRSISTLSASDFPAPQSDAFEPTLDALAARGCPSP